VNVPKIKWEHLVFALLLPLIMMDLEKRRLMKYFVMHYKFTAIICTEQFAKETENYVLLQLIPV
jgi:hypothetical protein